MSLRFCFGPSGAGKSYKVYQEMIERSMQNPKQNFLILVPDQFTMQTQKELVTLHKREGIEISGIPLAILRGLWYNENAKNLIFQKRWIMKLYAPAYYREFACIADRCPHSCCVGWEIDVDGETACRYRALCGGYGDNVRQSVEETDGVMHFVLS